jgi:dTDP-4-dehydrorhamnose 3,5-epimerase
MKVTTFKIKDVILLQPTVFEDSRGFFLETYNAKTFHQITNSEQTFVMDTHSKSRRGVLRGLHYQVENPQGKLIRVVAGEIFDVAVDIRRSSPTFGQWISCTLSAEEKNQIWIPPGFAHGFLTLSEVSEVLYKNTDFYAPQNERCIIWNDKDLSIDWPLDGIVPTLSEKDQRGMPFRQAEVFD